MRFAIISSILFTFISISYALEIRISEENNVSMERISEKEINEMISLIAEKGLKINKKDAKRYIYENKVLANAYIKKFGLFDKDLIRTKLILEENLANRYVINHQNKKNIDKDILKSYYKVHKKKFITEKKIRFAIKEFNDFDSAYKFYNYCKKNLLKKTTTALDECKGIEEYIEYSKLNPLFKDVFEKYEKEKISPPIFLNGKFFVFTILKVEKERQKTFDESEKQIRQYLLSKTFYRTRKKLLKNILSKENKGFHVE